MTRSTSSARVECESAGASSSARAPGPWRDPIVWIGAGLGAAATAHALFAGRYLPSIDWANHLGLISVLAHGERTGALAFFERSLAPGPYFTFYALTALLAQMMPVEVAARIVLTVAAGGLALGASALAAATGRSPRLGLIGPIAMFGTSAYWGFLSFEMATPVLLFTLAATETTLDRCRRSQGGRLIDALCSRDVVRLSFWLALLYLSHGFLFLVACAVIGVRAIAFGVAHARRATGAALKAPLVALVAVVPAVLLMLPATTLFRAPSVPPGVDTARLFEFTPLQDRLHELPADLLGQDSRHHLAVIYAAVALWIGWMAASLMRRRPAPSTGDGRGLEIYALTFTALYLWGPISVNWPSWVWPIYPRFAVIAAVAILLLPRCDLSGRLGALLAFAAIAVVAGEAEISAVHAERFTSWARKYDPIRTLIPPGARVLGLTAIGPRDRPLRHYALANLYMYHMVDGASYVNYLFEKHEQPVHLRRDRPAPRAPYWATPLDFDPRSDGRDYDFLVLRGQEIVNRTLQAELHDEIGRYGAWVLFRTKSPPPPPMP